MVGMTKAESSDAPSGQRAVTVLTLGLFLFVINALTFQMASGLLDGFQVNSFADALLGSVLYSLWGLVIDAALERLMPTPRWPQPPSDQP